MKWIRKCQECGNIQEDKQPTLGTLPDAYANRKCKKCKSEALDYGQHEKDSHQQSASGDEE